MEAACAVSRTSLPPCAWRTPACASTACWDAPRRPRRGHGGEERVRQEGALRGTQISSAALAEATAKLKTVDDALFAVAKVFFVWAPVRRAKYPARPRPGTGKGQISAVPFAEQLGSTRRSLRAPLSQPRRPGYEDRKSTRLN